MNKHKYIALVVDDEPEMVEMVTDYLVSFLDIKVVGLASGNEAISCLINSSVKYDVILSDINMQNGTGLELYHFNAQNNQIPFIFISASQKVPYPEVVFIEKPFKLECLKIALLSCLRSRESLDEGAIN